MKNKHPHTNTENTLFGTLEPIVSVVDYDFVWLLLFPRYKRSKLDHNSNFPKSPIFSVHSLYNFFSWYLNRCELAQVHEPVTANWLFIQFVFNPVDIF
jgi:hypothetical protein